MSEIFHTSVFLVLPLICLLCSCVLPASPTLICSNKNEAIKHLECTNSGSDKITLIGSVWPTDNDTVKITMKDINLRELGPGSFDNLPNLKVVDLSRNSISPTKNNPSPTNALKNLHLHSLDMSHNRLVNIGDLSGSHSTLRTLNASHNNLFVYFRSKYAFPLQHFKSLETLDLSYNRRIDLISPPASDSLRTLRLEHSLQLKLHIGSFSKMPNLKSLHFSSPTLAELPVYVFKGLESLAYLRIDNTSLNIKKMPRSVFDDCPELLGLTLTHNNLQTLHERIFTGLNKLETIELQSNQLETIEERVFEKNSKLEIIRLNHNILIEIKRHFKNLPNLQRLDLSHNRLKSIAADAFSDNTKLKVLNLRNNNLRHIEEFADFLHPLKKLYLSYNEISDLPQLDMPSLTHLDIDNNFIFNLDRRFADGLSSLKRISLACNNMTKYPHEFLGNSYYCDATFTNVALHGNPWKCSCLFEILKIAKTCSITINPLLTSGKHVSCIYTGENAKCFGTDDVKAESLKKFNSLKAKSLCPPKSID